MIHFYIFHHTLTPPLTSSETIRQVSPDFQIRMNFMCKKGIRMDKS